MKKTTIKTLSYLFISGILITNIGCSKVNDFGTTNVNPNGSSFAATGTLIATVESRLGSRSFGTNDAAAPTLEGFYCQYFAEPTYPGASKYATQQVSEGAYYNGILEDCQQVITRNTNASTRPAAAGSGSNESQLAIARILKAYIYWIITDLYGDIPYTQALQGGAFSTPKYDDQQSIYKDLIKELTEANAQFDDAGAPVTPDLIYGSLSAPTQNASWRRLSNSLRMLMSLRLSKRFPAAGDYAATEFSKAFTSPYSYISTKAQHFSLAYPGNTLQYNNPWFGTGNSADLGEAQTMTDALAGFSDSRISQYGDLPTGVPYGLSSAAPTGVSYAKILAAPYKQPANPKPYEYVFISASATLLAIAEASERGWIDPAIAKTYYDAGVTASFDQWNVAMPATYLTTGVANYLTGAGFGPIGGPSVAGSNALTPNKIARINVQQWFSFYPLGRQGWANWRRTITAATPDGIPALKPTIYASNTGGKIPRRIPYGPSDYASNAVQVALAAAAIGGDTQDTHVWWDL